MAVPGYGPGHYLALADEALSRRPNVIAVGYYLGNDLYDAYAFAYNQGPEKRPIPVPNPSDMISHDPKVIEALQRAETIDPVLLRSLYVNCTDPRPVPDPHLQRLHDIMSSPPLPPLEGNRPPAPWRQSLLLSLLERLADRAVAADYGPPLCIRYDDGRLTTVFTPGYRLIALDTTDPRIVEGERVAMLAFQRLDMACRQAGCRLYVVMIPTKEMAYRDRVVATARPAPSLVDLWEAETSARVRALSFFERHDIRAIDTLPALQAAIANGRNPYRSDGDGHPVAAGHDAIATAVAERLGHDGL